MRPAFAVPVSRVVVIALPPAWWCSTTSARAVTSAPAPVPRHSGLFSSLTRKPKRCQVAAKRKSRKIEAVKTLTLMEFGRMKMTFLMGFECFGGREMIGLEINYALNPTLQDLNVHP